MERITNVKVGDHVICFDEYLHDYEEHELIIQHIESDPEYATNTNPLGIVCFGEDLTTDDEEMMLSRVDEGNFICIKN